MGTCMVNRLKTMKATCIEQISTTATVATVFTASAWSSIVISTIVVTISNTVVVASMTDYE